MDLDEMYREHARTVYCFIYAKCQDPELAQDITQTVFLKAILQIDDFRGQCKLSSWLCQIARNEWLNYCRKNASTAGNDQTSGNMTVNKGGIATNAYATVFACLSNYDQDENEIMRQWIRIKGERALLGDDQLARDGKQCGMILSEAEASGKEDGFSKNVEEHLQGIMEAGYFPTDLVAQAVGYDKERKLYLYRMTLEFTEKEKGDRALTTFDCYRQAGYYLFKPETVCVYGESIEKNVRDRLEILFGE